MADEISITGSLTINKAAVMTSPGIGKAVNGLLFDMTGNGWIEGIVSAATTATAIPMGGVTSPHFSYFKNLDSTNYLKIRNGASGADLIKLMPGEAAFVPLDNAATIYCIGHTSPCLLEYLICDL